MAVQVRESLQKQLAACSLGLSAGHNAACQEYQETCRRQLQVLVHSSMPTPTAQAMDGRRLRRFSHRLEVWVLPTFSTVPTKLARSSFKMGTRKPVKEPW